MKILLRNLSNEVCENELESLFGAYGTVKMARVLRDEGSGQSRGIAIIDMENGGEAAIMALNHANYKSQYLIVSRLEAEPEKANLVK